MLKLLDFDIPTSSAEALMYLAEAALPAVNNSVDCTATGYEAPSWTLDDKRYLDILREG